MKNILKINNNYDDPEKKDFEVVERKGIGHPDTIADALANECSKEYSKACLKEFGAVLHHNLDKFYFGGGWVFNDFGLIDKKKPIIARINGRISKNVGDKIIDVDGIMIKTIKRYVKSVLPHIDIEKDLLIDLNYTQYTKFKNWFSPNSIDDVPDAKKPSANDTSAYVCHYPMTTCELLAYELEHFFWDYNEFGYPSPKFENIGQDIKVMVTRIDNKITANLCVPVIASYIKNQDEYDEIIKSYETKLQVLGNKICEDTDYDVNVKINELEGPHYRKYMLGIGTCAECGEEGIVGRGNNFSGIISVGRPYSMEAPFGKNPRYHSGRVLSYLCNKLSKKIYEQLKVKNTIYVVTKNKDELLPPYLMYIQTSNYVSEDIVKEIIKREMIDCDYLNEILK
ncbi:MAG: hypothetical protein IKJ43_01180 [Bacilli bacterium]|nr:hypothetical protein [Bacilli bacterium]